jgi:glutaredoxin
MAEKIQLERSELPPTCPHCKATLTEMTWHKVKGGPGLVGYIAIMSCPHCKKVLGAVGS